jgi:hypothetical protein
MRVWRSWSSNQARLCVLGWPVFEFPWQQWTLAWKLWTCYYWGYCHYCDYFEGKCTAWGIWIERLSSAQGPLRTIQLFGVWPHQVQWCALCSGFTATRSLRNHFTAVTNWTSLWFGLQVLKMVLSWSRQIQCGTHGFCSFSLPPHKPTPDPNRLTVLSCRRWKHITILRMVFIDIMIIVVIVVIVLSLSY